MDEPLRQPPEDAGPGKPASDPAHDPVRDPDHDPAPETLLGTTRDDRLVIGILLGASLVLLGAHWVQLSGCGTHPIEIDRVPRRPADFQLDLNTATWIEFSQLEGIGPTLAQRIVEDRRRNGRFGHVEDLQRVHGIGPRTFARLKPWIRIGNAVGEEGTILAD